MRTESVNSEYDPSQSAYDVVVVVVVCRWVQPVIRGVTIRLQWEAPRWVEWLWNRRVEYWANRSSVRSHRLVIRLLHNACFACFTCMLGCTHSLAHSLWSSWERGFLFMIQTRRFHSISTHGVIAVDHSGPNDSRIDAWSTGPLAGPFARWLAPLIRSLAHSLRSLPRSWESEFLMSQNDLVLSHSGIPNALWESSPLFHFHSSSSVRPSLCLLQWLSLPLQMSVPPCDVMCVCHDALTD